MSEHNYAGMAFKAEREKNPEAFLINENTCKAVEDAGRVRREQDAKTNPPTPQNVYEEYKQLRGRLHWVELEVQSSATHFDNINGLVSLCQKNLDKAEKEKKAFFKAGNNKAEPHSKNLVERLTDELDAAKSELKAAKTRKERAVKALEEFSGHERIAELQTQLGL